MRLTPHLVCVSLVVIGSVLVTAPASAQFGLPVTTERGRQEVLVVQLGVSGSAIENTRDAGSADTVDPLDINSLPPGRTRYFADVNGSIRYRPLPKGDFAFGLTASSAARRYEGRSEFAVLGHAVGGGMSWEMTPRTSMAGFAGFAYLPSYALDTLQIGDLSALTDAAGMLPPSVIDFSLTRRVAYGSSGGINLRQNLTRRASLSFTYAAARSDFEAADVPTLMSQNLSGRFRYVLTRDMSVRLGYGRRLVEYIRPTGVETLALDDIDIGIDFRKAFSITRSTSFSFSTGSTIEDDEGDRKMKVTGSANLSQELGRRGNLALSYRRGGELRSGFGRPVFADSLSLNGRWTLVQSLVASGSAWASLGTSGRTSATDNKVQSIAATARLSYQLWRRGQIYAQYLSYFQDIDRGVDFISSVQREQRNRTVRVGLSFSFPLVTAVPRPARPALERN